jgi:hypothetical protein
VTRLAKKRRCGDRHQRCVLGVRVTDKGYQWRILAVRDTDKGYQWRVLDMRRYQWRVLDTHVADKGLSVRHWFALITNARTVTRLFRVTNDCLDASLIRFSGIVWCCT